MHFTTEDGGTRKEETVLGLLVSKLNGLLLLTKTRSIDPEPPAFVTKSRHKTLARQNDATASTVSVLATCMSGPLTTPPPFLVT